MTPGLIILAIFTIVVLAIFATVYAAGRLNRDEYIETPKGRVLKK